MSEWLCSKYSPYLFKISGCFGASASACLNNLKAFSDLPCVFSSSATLSVLRASFWSENGKEIAMLVICALIIKLLFTHLPPNSDVYIVFRLTVVQHHPSIGRLPNTANSHHELVDSALPTYNSVLFFGPASSSS